MQVEVGLRTLDPLFGRKSSDAFKEASRAIAAEPDAAVRARDAKAFEALDDARLKLQKQMLDVMRNPNFDIASRKNALNKLLGEFEGKVKRSSRLKPDAIDFAEVKKQIGALTAETFNNMLTVDNSGTLTQKGVRVGTLRGLMEKIKAINNLFRKNGVPKELALSVSAPKDTSIPKEVKILSRTPKQVAPTTKKPSSPVDPTDQTADGMVVDIGVGLGDYARDAGGETGEIVKTEYGPSYTDPAMIRRDLTWEHTAPRVDVDSVLVLGDALQTLPMLFGAKSVKRVFINNINAQYAPGGASYKNLARGLGQVMSNGGRVEVQWTTESETTGGKTTSRGHITGEALQGALESTGVKAGRNITVTQDAKPVLDFDYSVEAPRGKSGAPSKTPPSNPVPQFRWIFTFGA
jgi:hypothetical protein